MFPLAFVNTSQDWLILQISLANLRVAHMASHWRMTIDVAKFNTNSLFPANYLMCIRIHIYLVTILVDLMISLIQEIFPMSSNIKSM
jgi:hypothetical protein